MSHSRERYACSTDGWFTSDHELIGRQLSGAHLLNRRQPLFVTRAYAQQETAFRRSGCDGPKYAPLLGEAGHLARQRLDACSLNPPPGLFHFASYAIGKAAVSAGQAARARCLRAHRPRCRRLRDRLESSGANPASGVPTVVEARDAHVLASLPGMDETAAADVNPAMTKAIEEHQIARLKAVAGDG